MRKISVIILLLTIAALVSCNEKKEYDTYCILSHETMQTMYQYDWATENEDGSYTVTIPETIDGNQVIALVGCFYEWNDIAEVIIPDSVIYIGDDTFHGCWSLKNIVLPENLKYIGANAFRDCYSLEYIEIPEGVDIVSRNTFAGCYTLREVVIKGWVKYIEDCAFASCTSLEKLNLPNNLVYIGSHAFVNCPLLEIEIPQTTFVCSDTFGPPANSD